MRVPSMRDLPEWRWLHLSQSWNPTMDELSDVKTAVSEAVTNAIIHGYDNPEEKVHMTCRIMGREVEIIVCDTGRGD